MRFRLICIILGAILLFAACGASTSAVKQPKPQVIDGVKVIWVKTNRSCPKSLTCYPCYIPKPDHVSRPNGWVDEIMSYGCQPDSYTVLGGETLRDLATLFGTKPEDLCVNLGNTQIRINVDTALIKNMTVTTC